MQDGEKTGSKRIDRMWDLEWEPSGFPMKMKAMSNEKDSNSVRVVLLNALYV